MSVFTTRFLCSDSLLPARSRPLLALLLSASLAPLAVADQEPSLTIADPYFRETPPGQQRTAGFFVASNDSERDCALLAASAPGIERLELHEHRHEEGMMRMRQVESLPLPAAGTLELSPGGYHLMGFGVSPLTAGDSVAVELDFGDCGTRTVSFAVIDPRR